MYLVLPHSHLINLITEIVFIMLKGGKWEDTHPWQCLFPIILFHLFEKHMTIYLKSGPCAMRNLAK